MDRATLLQTLKLGVVAMCEYRGCKGSGMSEHQFPLVAALYEQIDGDTEQLAGLLDSYTEEQIHIRQGTAHPW